MSILGIAMAALVLAALGFFNWFAATNLCRIVQSFFPNVRPAVVYAVYGLLTAILVLQFVLMILSARGVQLPSSFKRTVAAIAYIWLGVFVYLLLSLFACKTGFFVLKITKLLPDSQTVRRIYGAAVIGLTILVSAYGLLHAADTRIKSYDVSVKTMPASEELRVVLLSDIHLGAVHSETVLKNAVSEINRLSPDVVCIAGDIFDGDYQMVSNPDKASELLRSIQSKYGVYACLGNHDSGVAYATLTQFFRQSNVVLLDEKSATVEDRLVLIGRLDGRATGDGTQHRGSGKLFSAVDTGLPTIVLDHNPMHISEYQNVDLILCGHTHKGQIFPANIVTDLLYEVDYGYYRKNADSPQVIVTSGVGIWGMPMRVCSDSEVVCITLHGERE